MQIVPATIKEAAPDEPFTTQYGDKYAITLTPDDPNSPKVNSYGEIKIFRSPDHGNVPYMKSLNVGDRVNLVYVDKGSRSYYDFVMDSSPQPITNKPKIEAVQPTAYVPPPKVYQPMSDAETEAFVAIATEQIEVLLSLMMSVPPVPGVELSTEDKRTIATTAYIQANKMFSRGMVLPGHEPELFEDEVEDSVDQSVEFSDLFKPDNPESVSSVANAFIKACSAVFGETTDAIVKRITVIGMTSDLVLLDYEACYDIMKQFVETERKTRDNAAAIKYAAGLVDELADSLEPEVENDDPPF
jgi:hypothetical protein